MAEGIAAAGTLGKAFRKPPDHTVKGAVGEECDESFPLALEITLQQ